MCGGVRHYGAPLGVGLGLLGGETVGGAVLRDGVDHRLLGRVAWGQGGGTLEAHRKGSNHLRRPRYMPPSWIYLRGYIQPFGPKLKVSQNSNKPKSHKN